MTALSDFRAVGLHDLGELNWSVEELLLRIKELDQKLFSEASQPVGTIDQWLPIFERNPQTWRAIVTKDGDLAAYWQTAAVNDDLYFALKNGVLSEAALDASFYVDSSKGGIFNLYFVSICSNPAYRSIEANLMLMNSFFSAIKAQSEIGVFFREITCSVCSPEGEQIAKTFRLDFLRNNPIGRVYAGQIGNILNRFKGTLDVRFPGLYSSYVQANLIF